MNHPALNWRGLGVSLFAAVTVLTTVSCAHRAPEPRGSIAPKPLKTGLFVDQGSHGAGVVQLAMLVQNSPELDLTLLDGADLRAGKLKGLDLLIIPGGSSALQYKMMQEEGAEAVRKFVAGGGAYFGVCAGFHCALNRDERIRLLPYTWYFGGAQMRAVLSVELSEKAAKRLEVPAGRYRVKYSRGPISRRCEQPGTGWAEELAVYTNDMSWPKITFSGAPAMLYGEYGQGKVIATSFHPEMLKTTHPIALGCIYAVTGVRPKPVMPAKYFNRTPIAYYIGGLSGKRWVSECLELNGQPDLDFQLATSLDDILDHVDVLICPNHEKGAYRNLFNLPLNQPLVKAFLDRGGKLLVAADAIDSAPKHPNVIPLGKRDSLLLAVRNAVKALR